MDDLISRQAVLDAFWKLDIELKPKAINAILNMVNSMPLSVNPQELKIGHWYYWYCIDERSESNKEIICSSCEQPIFKYHKVDFDYRPKYCPNCGAKMQ